MIKIITILIHKNSIIFKQINKLLNFLSYYYQIILSKLIISIHLILSFIALLKDDINSLVYIFQVKSNEIFADEMFFLKTDSRISSHQENDTYMKSESMSVIKRESEIGINSNYSPSEFSHIITRNTSISKKYSSSYTSSFSDMNNDHMKSSFYIMIISI